MTQPAEETQKASKETQEPPEEAQKRSKQAQEQAERRRKRSERIDLSIKLARVLCALGVVIIGIISLWRILHPAPAAEDFTRVGGRTSVETAVDAARFWLRPPETVVKVPADASPEIMLSAGKCAMRNDAPVLITSPDRASRRLVRVTIANWRTELTADNESLKTVTFLVDGVTTCPARGRIPVRKLSLLRAPSQHRLTRLLRSVRPKSELRRFVVFATAIAPRHIPDVAVGLALAAHLASARDARVSFVLLQRYLEADPTLERRLQGQHGLVTGGVVLGQTQTVPDDAIALLRRLLSAPDQQGLLGQVTGELGSLGDFLGVLLALIAALSVAKAAQPLVEKLPEVFGNRPPRSGDIDTTSPQESGEPPVPVASESPTASAAVGAQWRDAFGNEHTLRVTCWLNSGLTVTGTFDHQNTPAGATQWRLTEAQVLPTSSTTGPTAVQVGPTLAYVLVPVEDIVLVGANEPGQSATPGQAANTPQDALPSVGIRRRRRMR